MIENVVDRGIFDDLVDSVSQGTSWLGRELILMSNWKTAGSVCVFLVGLTAGVALVFFLGIGASGFGVISCIAGAGLGGMLFLKGRRDEEARIVSAIIAKLKVALNGVNDFFVKYPEGGLDEQDPDRVNYDKNLTSFIMCKTILDKNYAEWFVEAKDVVDLATGYHKLKLSEKEDRAEKFATLLKTMQISMEMLGMPTQRHVDLANQECTRRASK